MARVKERFSILVFTLIAAVALGVLYLFNPSASILYPTCPFLGLTGCYCPGCGSLRAASAYKRSLDGGFWTKSSDGTLVAIYWILLCISYQVCTCRATFENFFHQTRIHLDTTGGYPRILDFKEYSRLSVFDTHSLSGPIRKFFDARYGHATADEDKSGWCSARRERSRSRSWRVNFQANGLATCS